MLTLGSVAGRLRLVLDPASDFVRRVELQQPAGAPVPWPSGTSAWLRISANGTTFYANWPATISGSIMSWHVPAADVAKVPLTSWAELWVQYPDTSAFVWLRGPVESGCEPGGVGGIVAVPGISGGAVAVPVPGPVGPAGPPGSGGSAVVVTGIAGVALSGHRAVVRGSDGRFVPADNTNPKHLGLPIGITTGAATPGSDVQVCMFGEMTEPSWSWAPGPIFLGATGALTQSVPTGPAAFVAQLAAATASSTVFVDRSPSIAL
ncbi:hypothetical protein D5S18_22130 [Nocardia panacis]|uniref:LtfC/p132/Gp6 beta-sandwich domain-containing protein n=1 Tax=Nocardia panacis TaxID=2340916 RepID=A0A3A4KJ67_9NOCA|nr:hypothetical protein D5S18_22130 [Nocardia panacis]